MTTYHTSRNTPFRLEFLFGGQPIYRTLVSSSIVCFAGTFITDLVYWRTVAVMWEIFSDWLLTAGIIIASLAIIALLIDLVRGKLMLSGVHAVGYVLAVLVSLVNAFIHSRDAYTAVVPTGLTLSALALIILLSAAGVERALTSRPRVGANT